MKIIKVKTCGDCPLFDFPHCDADDVPREHASTWIDQDEAKPPPGWCPLPSHDPRSVAVEYLSHLVSTEADDVVACEINRVVERMLQEGER